MQDLSLLLEAPDLSFEFARLSVKGVVLSQFRSLGDYRVVSDLNVVFDDHVLLDNAVVSNVNAVPNKGRLDNTVLSYNAVFPYLHGPVLELLGDPRFNQASLL